ncbi:hypothetical protein S922_15905 [Salmonella enterica subsp. enterica]|nr:hypothetical protein [Salmonella enterica subsp. enterica]EAW9772768.1 hypothetical protein [Salmonella enterica]
MLPDSDNSPEQLKSAVLRTLKDTLNQYRKLAEEEEDEDLDSPPTESAPAQKSPVGAGTDGDTASFLKKELISEISSSRITYIPQPVKQVGALDPDSQRKHLNNKDFEEEIKLKKFYGFWFLVILACKLLIMNGVFILDGLKWVAFDPLTLQLYMGGTLTEVFGLVLVVTKYLFKRK